MERHMIKHTVFSVFAFAAFTGSALAHPGEHAFSIINSFTHLLTAPDHLAMMAVAAAAAFGVWRWSRAKV